MAINIKDNINMEHIPTARELNILDNDWFIEKNPNAKAQALRRLQAVQSIKDMFKHEINSVGTSDMPIETVDLYERLWIVIKEIEKHEADTAVGR